MDSGGNSVAESVGESPEPEQAARSAGKPSKGRGLRRWRRIPREHHHEGSPASPVAAGSGPGEDLSQLHKRRLALPAGAPKGKDDAAVEEESSVASVESSCVPPPPEVSTPPPAPTSLDPNLGLLIATAGFSVGAGGADSENSDDRNSKSSTAASAPRGALPRHEFSFGGFGRERERARSRVPGGTAHSKNLRAARVRGGASARAAASPASPVEPENSRSSVESNLRGSSSAQPRESCASITSNGVHKVLFPDDDDHNSDGEAPSEEARYATGGFYKQNGSVVGRLVMENCGSDGSDRIFEEASVGKFENGGTRPGLDPYVESIALLQSAQETLENEIQRFVEIRKETDENSTTQSEEFVEELSEKLQALELKLEQATILINEKDSKILELNALNQARQEACNSNLSMQSDIEQLLLEKMEAEIHCFILTRASQAWTQVASDEMQKSLVEDHKSIETKLRHSENRAMMLEEMVDKLEAQCKELSEASEVLKLQARASRTSLFCSIQLVLVCIALGTTLMRFLPSSTEFVPT
ncbi:hypothetical protein PR202_ga15488 [Eleusine coracana subsp. coracana]|uniref:WPP domain-interacting protein 2 n=1 Tax=Eleusine coracana subsp. coracana TaxID=191504 RepID=A0AAV5CKB0_ELECO|nr:hypothetical protein QOZ80_6BG0492490 [Eleusine coracana subsp. coracana]GJM98473.1 hypothetical protein PR202_ga15488 [Eleusine coracana subsp. coracana]